MKKALIIGIDDYPGAHALRGCVNDALEMSSMLEKNGDGSPNFEVMKLISHETEVTSELLHDSITQLFSGEAETAVLYFAGHGLVDDDTNDGQLISMNGAHPNWGVPLRTVINLANEAYPRIKSSVIILDSCKSGAIGEMARQGKGVNPPSVIGDGVTILTASHRSQLAVEEDGHGRFSSILLDGLSGAACDILGRVTPAALYAYVDQTLSNFEQRPIYKANVQRFITVRNVEPRVNLDILRRLPKYFPNPSHKFKLDPSYEPERGEEAERLKDIPVNEDHARIFKELQKCCNVGLIRPTDHEHMWHSAIFYGGCELTASGAHYRFLASANRI